MRQKLLVLIFLIFIPMFSWAESSFIRVRGSNFYGDSNRACYFVGTNFWYGPILGAGEHTRKRLCRELDSLACLGVNHLKIMIPSKQMYDDKLETHQCSEVQSFLYGLDFLLNEMRQRNMFAVVSLVDNRTCYIDRQKTTAHAVENVDNSIFQCESSIQSCKESDVDVDFQNFLHEVLGHKNSITGISYVNDEQIMSWQISCPGYVFEQDSTSKICVARLNDVCALVKSIDYNHLLSVEIQGCLVDEEKIAMLVFANRNVDYLTMNLNPVEAGWASSDRLFDALPNVYQRSISSLELYDRLSRKLDKPFLIDGFSYPRDNNFYDPSSGTMARDAFYAFVFQQLKESRNNLSPMSGCFFEGWGGEAVPKSTQWEVGDDYLYDAPGSPQGQYSVYKSDRSTLEIIRNFRL